MQTTSSQGKKKHFVKYLSLSFTINFVDFVLVYEEGEKPPPPKHLEQRQKFLENLAKSQLEFEEVKSNICNNA